MAGSKDLPEDSHSPSQDKWEQNGVFNAWQYLLKVDLQLHLSLKALREMKGKVGLCHPYSPRIFLPQFCYLSLNICFNFTLTDLLKSHERI